MSGSSVGNIFRLMDDARIGRTIDRISREILEQPDSDKILLVGLNTRGFAFAEKLAESLEKAGSRKPECFHVDVDHEITDVTKEAIQGRDVILADDVIFSGKSMLSALKTIISTGEPSSIRVAVLVDRGHRKFPVFPTFTGMFHPTKLKEHVRVNVAADGTMSTILESDYGQ